MIEYHLAIYGKGESTSFSLETFNEANEVFKTLREKFKNYIVSDKNSIKSGDEIVQLSVTEVFLGHVPPDTLGSFSPEEWFHVEIYDDIIKEARKLKG